MDQVFKLADGPPYGHLNMEVSLWAIELLMKERAREIVQRCGCRLHETHGLPCKCKMDALSDAGMELHPHHLHRFWSSLVYESPPDGAKWEDHDATEREIFAAMVEDVYRQGPAAVRKASQLLLPHIRPQVAGLLEPRESEAPKGRPPKRSNTRDPSWFEHERTRTAKRRKTNENTRKTHKTTPAGGVSKSQHMQVHNERNVCPYLRYIPLSVRPLLRGWFDPKPDGQCGFRAMSHVIYGDEEQYLQMRQNLVTEINDHRSIYEGVYLYRDGSLEATRHRLGRRTAGSCTQEYWFEEVDLLTFATLYNCAIVVYGLYNERTTYGYTVLPLTAPEGVTQPSQVITLAFTGAHWVRLYFGEVDGVTPIPHFSPQWSHFRDMLRIADWDSLYEPGRQLYVDLGGHHPANDDDKSD
ncbi:unnamed protein product [Linum tenue]|uniref:OTU domain-containing protein n=1 Tax=Linum tenue TaxID=586396 RepID=A0AAV0MPT1_9ROSI|nr:unnamed protein product [Linum tenue]